MLPFVLIGLVIVTVARDGFTRFPMVRDAGGAWAVLAGVLPFLLVVLVVHLGMKRLGARLDRTGDGAAVAAADLLLSGSRAAVLLLHAAAVLGFGWLDAVRRAVGGDVVLVDEALACAMPVLTIIAGYVSNYEIERRLAEASLIRSIDAGEGLHPIRTRAQYVGDQTRHQVAIILVPIAMLGAWSEIAARIGGHMLGEPGAGEGAAAGHWAEAAVAAMHFAGVLALLLVMPAILRRIWDTVPLEEGELRIRLEALCARQGVRCREYLVWRTHGSMINGALVGLMPFARYILLTDALLERLPMDQIEAVMAHEAGHARRRHLPWLIAAIGATVMVSWSAAAFVAAAAIAWNPAINTPALGESAGALGLVASLGAGYLVFGHVSRRFEQQADAFAVQHLSGWSARRGAAQSPTPITPEAVAAMCGALLSVARLNHVPLRKFSWRHGSIAGRIDRLRRLEGADAARLPIDRRVRRIKATTALVILLVAGIWGWSFAA